MLLITGINGKAIASCAPQRGYQPFDSHLFLGTITVPATTAVGQSVDGLTHQIDNTGGAGPNWTWYMMYCASGSALMWLTVTDGSNSVRNKVFDTSIPGVGVTLTYWAPEISVSGRSSKSIGPCPLDKIAGYSCGLRSMTFYFHQGYYDVKVIKTSEQTGVGEIAPIVVKNAGNGSSIDLGVFTLTGTIGASGCTISDENKNLDIPMGDYPITDFKGPGSATAPVDFQLSLNCPTVGTSVKVTTTSNGGAQNAANGVLNLSNGSTATGLGLQLLKSDGTTPLPLNTQIDFGKTTTAETTYKLYARYLQVAETVTSGTANAMATFTLNYE